MTFRPEDIARPIESSVDVGSRGENVDALVLWRRLDGGA